MKKSRLYRHQGMKGERALIAAVMAAAVDDALERGKPKDVTDAQLYFFDGRYQHHLSLLGLPEDFIPEEFTK
jgi:hypothetical protein